MPIGAIAAFLVVGLLFFSMWKLSAATAREETISVSPTEFSSHEIRAALERMGCVVSTENPRHISGVIAGGMGSWGQEVSVTYKDGTMHVRSSFVQTQAFGGKRNQGNVDSFKQEWKRRLDRQINSPEQHVLQEEKAIGNAKSAIRSGWTLISIGSALVAFALLGSLNSSPRWSSVIRLFGMGASLAGIGLFNLRVGTARIKKERT
jgi:hypothetical protein